MDPKNKAVISVPYYNVSTQLQWFFWVMPLTRGRNCLRVDSLDFINCRTLAAILDCVVGWHSDAILVA
jgi:hypothetical protein